MWFDSGPLFWDEVLSFDDVVGPATDDRQPATTGDIWRAHCRKRDAMSHRPLAATPLESGPETEAMHFLR